MAKFTEEESKKIYDVIGNRRTGIISKVARKHNVSYQYVYQIANGKQANSIIQMDILDEVAAEKEVLEQLVEKSKAL